MLQDYTVEFVERVKKDFPVFRTIDSQRIPISFTHDFTKDSDGKREYTSSGELFFDQSNLLAVRINSCWDDLEKLKMAVRHECLHYMLLVKGLKAGDNESTFWYLATKYDAHPYEQMPEIEQYEFEKFGTYPEGLMNLVMFINSKDIRWSYVQNKGAAKAKELYKKYLKTKDPSLLREAKALSSGEEKAKTG